MKTLREYIQEAEERKVAIGHFNISNIDGFWATVNASKNLDVPVIIGVSEGERDFIGVKQVKKLVESVQQEGLPIFLNADHTFSLERVKEVVEADFDAVIIDAAEKSFEENVAITKEVVAHVRHANRRMLVEAELGFIGKSSKILDEVPQGALTSETILTKPEQAKEFVEATRVDLFAPAVGNIHGMVKSGNPKLNIGRIREIKEAVGVPLVLHGGSGITDEEFRNAINAGISIIHINTELRVAYKEGLQDYLSEHEDEIAPYKYLAAGKAAMQKQIESRLSLFAGL